MTGLLLVATAPSSSGHTDLVSSSPTDGSSVPDAPTEVALVFNQDVSAQLSSVSLATESESAVALEVSAGETAQTIVADRDESYRGIFHLTGSGEANWAEFAREIFRVAENHGRKPVTVIPITSDQYPSPVKRPANSRLSGEKLERVYGIVLPDWRVSTALVVDRLLG
eukprot:gene38258-43332_t